MSQLNDLSETIDYCYATIQLPKETPKYGTTVGVVDEMRRLDGQTLRFEMSNNYRHGYKIYYANRFMWQENWLRNIQVITEEEDVNVF